MRGATTMRKKLVKHGNSRALVLDKTMLELLGIGEDDEVEVEVHGQALTVAAADTAKRRERLDRALGRIDARYHDTLRRLSE